MYVTAASTVTQVRERFPQAVVATADFRDEQTIILTPESLVEVMTFLRDSLSYEMLETVTAVHWPDRTPRFDVVYHLLSLTHQSELRLKTQIGQPGEEHPELPTVIGVYPGANWYEREVYDLFGIRFAGHPDLRRIVMPADWTTFPLRKDYPLTGIELPEPHWGGQVPYDVDPGLGTLYQQTIRSNEGRHLLEDREKINPEQEPGTAKPQ